MSTLRVNAVTNLNDEAQFMPVRATAQASTSGTSIDFTGIPTWVKRITVMMSGVSTSGTSLVQIQVGTSSGFVSTGYLASTTGFATSGLQSNTATAGFQIETGTSLGVATSVRHGSTLITNITGNTWVAGGTYGNSSASLASIHGGSLALAGVLDRVRITTVNGTDTFDAGTINIMYE